ncbi:hypothetical protein ACFUTV_42880 [Streptomyces sp. NPDC057298]|uniref:hypothetical protein n=1 Tax=Streptomyces sp. NPDC057298 TaxID=3346091 RepID=UPI003625D905
MPARTYAPGPVLMGLRIVGDAVLEEMEGDRARCHSRASPRGAAEDRSERAGDRYCRPSTARTMPFAQQADSVRKALLRLDIALRDHPWRILPAVETVRRLLEAGQTPC